MLLPRNDIPGAYASCEGTRYLLVQCCATAVAILDANPKDSHHEELVPFWQTQTKREGL